MIHTKKARFKLALTAGATFTAAIMLAGCSTGTDTASDSDDSAITVAMVTPESTGEFYGAMYCGAQAAADDQDVDLKIQGSPGVSTEEVMQVLQSVLATEPDGLLLTVWDNNAFNETLAPYTEAGNPLIMPDSFLSNDDYIQSVRTDSYQSSYDAAVQALTDFDVSSGKVLVVTDAPGNAIQTARAEGFRDAIEETSDLEVLEFAYVGGDSAESSQAVSSALAANPDLSVVFSTNIGAGTGAANGIATSDVEDVVHVGYDTAAAQVEELKAGGYDALIAQSPYQMGYDSMELMSQILKGDESADDVTEQTVYAPWALVTADNVDTTEISSFLYTSDCAAIG